MLRRFSVTLPSTDQRDTARVPPQDKYGTEFLFFIISTIVPLAYTEIAGSTSITRVIIGLVFALIPVVLACHFIWTWLKDKKVDRRIAFAVVVFAGGSYLFLCARSVRTYRLDTLAAVTSGLVAHVISAPNIYILDQPVSIANSSKERVVLQAIQWRSNATINESGGGVRGAGWISNPFTAQTLEGGGDGMTTTSFPRGISFQTPQIRCSDMTLRVTFSLANNSEYRTTKDFRFVTKGSFPNDLYWVTESLNRFGSFCETVAGTHQLRLIENQTFMNETVPLDGFHYRKCRFENVTFVWNGTGPSIMESNIFGKVRLKTSDYRITNTLALLQGMGVFKQNVEVHLDTTE